MKRLTILQCCFLTLIFNFLLFSVAFSQDKKESSLEQSEEIVKKYLGSFAKSGIPTSKTVDAAVQKAKSDNTIQAWETVARIANSYANVIDVLSDHYADVYRSKKSHSYIQKAADYETVRNRYLQIRNDAYIEIARLYLSKGDKTKALSYAVVAVQLSGVEPNTTGEDLIKKIVEYSE